MKSEAATFRKPERDPLSLSLFFHTNAASLGHFHPCSLRETSRFRGSPSFKHLPAMGSATYAVEVKGSGEGASALTPTGWKLLLRPRPGKCARRGLGRFWPANW